MEYIGKFEELSKAMTRLEKIVNFHQILKCVHDIKIVKDKMYRAIYS